MLSKKLTTAFLCAGLLSFSQLASAYGLSWIDRDYDFSKLGQVACLALDETAPYNAENNLLKESKRLKNPFSSSYDIDASMVDKVALGKLVKEKTGADAFLITKIVMNEDQIDRVEGRYFPVTMHHYTEVDGPNGKHIERERYFDTQHYCPAHDVNLHKLEVDFHLYDANTGKEIFSFNDVRRSYNRYQEDLFKDIAKEFFVSLRDTPKLAAKTRNRNIEMYSIQLNGSINDNDRGDRIYSILKALSSDLIIDGANVKTVLLGDKKPSEYALRTKVFNYYDAPNWVEPSVTTSEKMVRSWTEKIRVRQDAPQQKQTTYTVSGDTKYGKVNQPTNVRPSQPTYKEVSIEHREYRTEVSEQPGGYHFKANVTLNSQVYDKKTGQVVFNYNNNKSNDKRADAWKALVKDFYNKLSKGIKK